MPIAKAKSIGGVAVLPREAQLREDRDLKDAFTSSQAPASKVSRRSHRRRLSGTFWGRMVVDDDVRDWFVDRPFEPALKAAFADGIECLYILREGCYPSPLSYRFHVFGERGVGVGPVGQDYDQRGLRSSAFLRAAPLV